MTDWSFGFGGSTSGAKGLFETLLDIATDGPTANSIIIYNPTTQQWENAESIGSWAISTTALYLNGTAADKSAGMASADYPFYAGAYYNDRDTAPFRVTNAGVLYATGAVVDGSITATTGAIGGWNLTATELYSLASGIPSDNPVDGIVLSSSADAISVYEDAHKRVQIGMLSTGVYGIRGYDGSGADTLFELSDTGCTVGGWYMSKDLLSSASGTGVARIVLDKDKKRISIIDSSDASKVVMGYLDGLAKNGGGGDWGAGDYGFWAVDGDKIVIDGDTEYKSGDWIVENDGSVLIQNASSTTIIRLGTESGAKGLFLYNSSGVKLASLATYGMSSFSADTGTEQVRMGNLNGFLGYSTDIYGFACGDSSTYIKWDTTSGLQVKGAITVTSVSADAIVDGTTNKAYTGTEQTKLSGIAAGATKVTNTNQLTDGAGLGTTATWSGVSGTGKPANNADVTSSTITSGVTITGGGITINGGGSVKGGQTDYATGTGFFVGYSGSAYKFSVGDTTNYIKFDGSTFSCSLLGSFKTATSGQRVALDSVNNELVFYGDRGDTTIAGVVKLSTTDASNCYITAGNSSYGTKSGIWGGSHSSEGIIGYSYHLYGVYGKSIANHGICGETQASGAFAGVYGASTTGGYGVFGYATGSHAVIGSSSGGHGVYGYSTYSSGTGVYGLTTGSSGYGVYGEGPNIGGYFKSTGAYYVAVHAEGNIYATGTISGATIVDRTPFYEGDALAEIKRISGKDGQLDHSTLPEFAKKDINVPNPTSVSILSKGQEVEYIKEPGRDIGAMVSVLTVGMQQLLSRVEILEGGKK
jgi:hypothetical protein